MNAGMAGLSVLISLTLIHTTHAQDNVVQEHAVAEVKVRLK